MTTRIRKEQMTSESATADQVFAADGAGNVVIQDETGSGVPDYILVRDEKSANTSGGTATSGSWQTRTINTEVSDSGGHCSLPGSNVIRLAAGTYVYRISCPAYRVDRHKARLYNVTASAIVTNGEGTSEFSLAASLISTSSVIVGKFTIAATTDLRIEHRVQTTAATYGYGVESNLGEKEVYTVAEFWKVG